MYREIECFSMNENGQLNHNDTGQGDSTEAAGSRRYLCDSVNPATYADPYSFTTFRIDKY